MNATPGSSGNGTEQRFSQSDCPLSPGQPVPTTGLYEICHYDEPRVAIVLVGGEIFPSCRQCGGDVRFKLLRAAPHISEDPDFVEPQDPDNLQLVSILPTPPQLGSAHGFRFQSSIQAGRDSAHSRNLYGLSQESSR